MFTKEELHNLLAFLGRTQLKGTEAVTLVQLQQKIAKMLEDTKQENKETNK